MRTTAIIIALLSTYIGHSQPVIHQSGKPSWVKQHEYVTEVLDTSGTSGGYAYLLISLQRNLETKENFHQYAIKVMSEQGLSAASEINESFDPSYQKITFHSLNIIRSGKKISKLDPGKFEVLRREEEMSRAVYDKTLNAVYNLPDVRVGDIVEYSFTRKGSNPAFENHSFGGFYVQYSVPVSRFAHNIIASENKRLKFKSFQTSKTFSEKQNGKLKYYELILNDVPALLSDDQVPKWYDPFPYIQYSDFQSWNEVKDWALKLYTFRNSDSKALRQLVSDITKKYSNDEERIKECIRVAQADVRYLSFSDGIHGYKPHSPEMVFGQKYGDCKDKSFLLVFLLNKIGVTSHPALVTTEKGEILNEVLPNPWAFNHCIVHFNYNDSVYWIDPTLDPQLGGLKNYVIPTYSNALVINESDNGLDTIPFGNKNSLLNVLEEYKMDEVGGYVDLKVRTEFTGVEADDIRIYVRKNTKQEIQKDYLNFYARDYSEITPKKNVEFIDDTTNNIVTSIEEYHIKNFWNLDPEKGKIANLYARVLSSYLRRPDTKIRTMPLSITYPINIRQTIKIYLPEEWNIEDTSSEIESDAFTYRSSVRYNDKILSLRYTYSSKKSFVDTDATRDHIAKIDEVFDDIYYSIYKPLKTNSKDTKQYVIVALLIGVAVYFVSRKMRR